MEDKDKTIQQQNDAIDVYKKKISELEKEVNRLGFVIEFEKAETTEWKQKFSNLVVERKMV